MTREELAAALRKADAAGNADDARRLAGAIRQLDASAVSAPAPAKPAPMSQPDATPWGDGQAFDDMYARKPQTDPMNMPLMPGARTLTSGQPTRMKPPPAPRGPVMSPAQRRATQPDRDEAARVRKYNEELALMNAASPIPFKNTGPDGPLELNQERPDQFAGRATGAFVNSNIGVANTLGQLGLSTANAFGAAGDPSMQGALAGGEYGDITQRVADAAQQGGYVQNQQAVGDIIPSLPIPAATTPGEMGADVIGNLASVFTGFGAPILKGGKALSESLATVPGMSRTLRGVGVETGENAALAYGLSAGAAPAGSDRNMAGTQGAADPLNYVTIEGVRAVPRALKALDAPTTPTNAGGANLRPVVPQTPPVAPVVAATQTAPQAPTQPQTATAPPVPPIPPNAPAVTVGAPQPVPARSRAEQRADDLLIKKLAADGITMDDVRKIQARLARRGDSGVYETIGEIAALTDKSSGANLRGLQMAGGAAPGPLQEALVGLVNQNTEKLSPRLSRGATRATGQKADNAVATLDELENRLRTEATPAYDDAYATPVNPQVFANEILPVLNTPSGQKALQAARNNLASIAADLQGRAARGASERATMESQRAQAAVKSIDDFMADPVRGTAIPTTMALDYTKRAFDDVIADAGFGSDTARIVGGTKRNFADSVSQATGGKYGNALGVFEDVKRLEDAFEVGTQALNKKTWELERELAKGRGGSPWTAGEVEALAMGVARNIEDLIEANNQSALTKLLKDKALKNMATALGSQKAADMFEETIRRLGANREWGRRVAGGSDTAMRQAAIRDAGMEGEDAITRVLDRVETSGNQFSLPGLVNDVAVKPIARTAKDIYQRLRYPGVYDEEVNRALIPLIGKPMTEGNLNEVIRRVEARMAEKGLIPPVQPAAVAAPPPAPRSRPRGPRGNPPGTTSSASATGTGIVAGGVLGAMAPADDENEQFINALFTAAGVGTAAGVAAKLAKGGKPPPASGKGAKPKAPPAKPAFDQRFMKEAQRLVSYNGGVDKALKAQQYVIDQLKNSKAPNAQDRLNRAVSVQYAIRRMADRSNRELDEIAATAPRSGPPGVKPPPVRNGMPGNSRGIADNLKQDALLAGFGSVGGSFANQDDPQAGALAGMGLALGGKYGPRLANAMRGAGRVKPPPVRGAAQGKFRGPNNQTFAGVNAKTADKVALARAQNMEAEGAGRDAIWDETGWFKGVDGKWRFEIDDSGAKIGSEAALVFNGGRPYPSTMQNVMEHPELYAAYPDMATDAGMIARRNSAAGVYEPELKSATAIAPDLENARSIMLHEAGGHGVQEVEGFARGGSIESFTQQKDAQLARDAMYWRKEIAGKRKQMPQADWIAVENALIDDYKKSGIMDWLPSREARDLAHDRISNPDAQLEEIVKVYGLDRNVSVDSPREMYRRTAGEVEARNVQTRDAMRMRGDKPGRPWETQDVPDDQQIVRFASGKAESRPKPPQTGNALAGKPPKGPPGTLSRMVAGGAVGGLAGSLGGDANAQEDLTGKISQTEQTIAELKKAMADLDKITDPFEKQRFLKAQGYYAGKIDGDIAGKTTEGMERWKAKKEAELEKAEAERKDLVRRDALQSNRPDPLMMALREYGPAVLGIGALFGMKYMRGGAAKASIKTAEAASNKLNKLITKGPVTGAMNKRDENRFANLNKLWQKGGASKEELPFKQDGAGKYKPNAKAKLPEELFADSGVWQTVTKYVKGKDVAIILGGGLDVAIAQPFIDKANENLSKAEAAWNDTPSDETAKALEDAKNEVAAYTLLQRIGMGVAAGRILGTFGGAYAKPMPNIPAAASEQAKLKQFIVSQKPPPKPRAKANPPAPKPRPKPRPKPPAPPAVPPTSQLPLPLKGGGKKKP